MATSLGTAGTGHPWLVNRGSNANRAHLSYMCRQSARTALDVDGETPTPHAGSFPRSKDWPVPVTATLLHAPGPQMTVTEPQMADLEPNAATLNVGISVRVSLLPEHRDPATSPSCAHGVCVRVHIQVCTAVWRGEESM